MIRVCFCKLQDDETATVPCSVTLATLGRLSGHALEASVSSLAGQSYYESEQPQLAANFANARMPLENTRGVDENDLFHAQRVAERNLGRYHAAASKKRKESEGGE